MSKKVLIYTVMSLLTSSAIAGIVVSDRTQAQTKFTPAICSS